MYLKYFRLKYRNVFEILWKYFRDELNTNDCCLTHIYNYKKNLLVQFLVLVSAACTIN